MSAPNWIIKHYDTEKVGKRELENVFTEFHLLLQKDTTSTEPRVEVNEVLQNIEWGRLPFILRVGILRTCWAARNYLTHWNASLRSVEQTLRDDGFSEDEIRQHMRGLL